ncbi:MAG: M1 family metallopeptidase [Bryobacteraceae bacterium]
MLTSCGPRVAPVPVPAIPKDIHSLSNPQDVLVTHADLDLDVLFDRKILNGSVTLTVERRGPENAPLILDTRDLHIDKAETSPDNTHFTAADFNLGNAIKFLGAPLTIQLPGNARYVRIRYSTSAAASGLQWLTPDQTAGKKHPFLFTQSEAVHARSWIPLQDTPSVRLTYTAHIRTPRDLSAAMSAENDPRSFRTGDYRFNMTERVPSYLIALAAGDLAFQAVGKRTGVYAEPSVLPKAAHEFEDMEKMLEAAEQLFGPYRWGRYDVLVLPPSFPFGGMENPRLTFATPTVLAGDKSLVSLVAHEMAHSWSGNLVTNATWSDFWLNEGFTVYIERRIVERVYGQPRAEMEAALGRQDLEQELAGLPPKDQILHVDLNGRDPDDGFTQVPYEKGALFLLDLERIFGRQRLDAYLKGCFDRFAFQSITTAQSLEYLHEYLLDKYPELAKKINVNEWVFQPGIPAGAPKPHSSAFDRVEAEATQWLSGSALLNQEKGALWSTQEWLHFLRFLPKKLTPAQMRDLDAAYHFTQTGNDEILEQWLLMAIRNRYEPAYPRLEEFLTSVGRRKYLKPLYEELVKTPEGRARAKAIYANARAGYHPIAQATVDTIVK